MPAMRDFYAPSAPMPLDQAHGLRRLFAGTRQHVLPAAPACSCGTTPLLPPAPMVDVM